MSAIFAHGHWRRRDPLEGLTENMRAALADAELGRLELAFGMYSHPDGRCAFHPATVRGLADRGLLRVNAGAQGRDPAFRLTARGKEAVAELHRRTENRLKLGGNK